MVKLAAFMVIVVLGVIFWPIWASLLGILIMFVGAFWPFILVVICIYLVAKAAQAIAYAIKGKPSIATPAEDPKNKPSVEPITNITTKKTKGKESFIAIVLGIGFLYMFFGFEVNNYQDTSIDPYVSDAIYMSEQQYGKIWPFTVKEGYLTCEQSSYVVFVANNIEYAVNGNAKSGTDYAHLEEIQKPNPDIEGTIMPTPINFISDGLSMCA